jgi:flagellar biosynthesis protein FlhG
MTNVGKKRPSRIIAVGAGKGGVGKSVVSANLSLLLAQRGHKVLAVDADLGGANLHTVLGIKPPSLGFSAVVTGDAELEDVAVPTGHPNLRMISGAFDDAFAANPAYQQKIRVLRLLNKFDADYVLLDLGAGTSLNTLDFFLFADHGVLVVLPEPTSVENAYRFLKAAFLRRLKNVSKAFGLRPILEAAKRHNNELGIRTPADLLRAVRAKDAELGAQVDAQMAAFRPLLVLNQCMTNARFDDRSVADDMVSGCRRFFGIELELLAMLPHDSAVPLAVRQRSPVIVTSPEAPISRSLVELSSRVLTLEPAHGVAA